MRASCTPQLAKEVAAQHERSIKPLISMYVNATAIMVSAVLAGVGMVLYLVRRRWQKGTERRMIIVKDGRV